MNAVSLNNLWSYLQGLTLTASNKRWLADNLYESAKSERQRVGALAGMERPMIRKEFRLSFCSFCNQAAFFSLAFRA